MLFALLFLVNVCQQYETTICQVSVVTDRTAVCVVYFGKIIHNKSKGAFLWGDPDLEQ